MAAPLSVEVEFGGGAELLFDGVKKHQITLPGQEEPWDLRSLLVWIKKNLLKERPELFLQGDSVRPGILVLINDADWELLATRWAPETSPQQKAACSPFWRGRSGLNLGLPEAWKGQCASVSSSATADELQCLKTWVTLTSQIRLPLPSCLLQEAGLGQQHLGRRGGSPLLPPPFWKSLGLGVCNSWPRANKRLGCLLASPGALSLETRGTPHALSHGLWSTLSGPLSARTQGFQSRPSHRKGQGSKPSPNCEGQPDQAVWRRGWPSPVRVPGHTVRHTSI
ncbi:ubiquitin-related modifier 1 isoform X2 [Phyllostomus discolor]|uniref:Ubiquitin-related modifier 1 n=1 Tax=Phyllostomus discolor TaxID=89673 RepID=A0A7E6DGK6_9CHIR|nr:ubiquitin-related modifier 1 isoform X2 [Phyllostomus discolor]